MPNPYMFVNFGLIDSGKAHMGESGAGYNIYIGNQKGDYGIESLINVADLYRKPGKLIGFLNPTDAKDFYHRFIELLEFNNRGKPKYKRNRINKKWSTTDPDFRNVLGMIEMLEGIHKNKPRRMRREHWDFHRRRVDNWARGYRDAYIKLLWSRGIRLNMWGNQERGKYALSFIPVIKTHEPFLRKLERMNLKKYGL